MLKPFCFCAVFCGGIRVLRAGSIEDTDKGVFGRAVSVE